MALNLPLAFWLALAAAAGLLLGLAIFRRLRWWPAWPLRVALAAMALLGAFTLRPQPRQAETVIEKQVLVADFSDSVLPAERTRLAQAASDWQKAQPGRVVVGAAAGAVPLLDPVAQAAQLDGRASDLKGGLELAAALIGDQPGRIFLATDGLAADPAQVQATLQQLTARGQQVELLQLQGRDRAADGSLGAIQAPADLWENTPFDVVAPVYPPEGGSLSKLALTVNGQLSQVQPQALDQGLYRFSVPPQSKGIVTLQVSADFSLASGGPDEFQANNQAYATLQIFASPKVLFVTDDAARDAHLIDTLKATGLSYDVLPPGELPTGLDRLTQYKVIMLSNFLAGQLSDEQMISLQVFVANQAGGLIFLGGRNSYTLGGYKNSLLEPLLPVKLEPPPRPTRPPVVFMLILDGSASMGVGKTVTPLNLAKEAAMRAVETLKAQDYIGLQVFSDTPVWTPHVRQLGDGLDLRQVLDQISTIYPGFGTRMYLAMQDALDELLKLPSTASAARHVLLLSDGVSEDGKLADFTALARRFYQEAHATVSTIALGEDVNKDIMQGIAAEGKGRFYAVRSAADLPKIMIAESQAGRGENIQTGDTVLKAAIPDHPLLSGMSEKDLPRLSGYNALSSKTAEGAEDILVSSEFSDPLLSGWQYGLGRVTAWMGDAGEEWTGLWPDPAREIGFWLQVIRYSLPNPAIGPSQASVQVGDTALDVSAELQSGGQPLDLAQVVFSYVDAAGKLQSLGIPQVASGAYQFSAPRPAPGAYRAALTYQDSSQVRQEISLPFAVNAPAEWQPANPGAGAANLAAWAKISGVSLADSSTLAAASPQNAPQQQAASGAAEDWLKYILLALVVLWPLEIALRRRWLSWNKV